LGYSRSLLENIKTDADAKFDEDQLWRFWHWTNDYLRN
jgi:hypothetical protein